MLTFLIMADFLGNLCREREHPSALFWTEQIQPFWVILGYFWRWICASTISVIPFMLVWEAAQGITARGIQGWWEALSFYSALPIFLLFLLFLLPAAERVIILINILIFLLILYYSHYHPSYLTIFRKGVTLLQQERCSALQRFPGYYWVCQNSKHRTRNQCCHLIFRRWMWIFTLEYRSTEPQNHRRLWNHPCSKEFLAKTNH